MQVKLAVDFSRAHFTDAADFSSVNLTADYINFHETVFDNIAQFNRARLGPGSAKSLRDFDPYTTFSGARFAGNCNFSNAIFRQSIKFDHAAFKSSPNFADAEFKRNASFDDITSDRHGKLVVKTTDGEAIIFSIGEQTTVAVDSVESKSRSVFCGPTCSCDRHERPVP